jgi:hypothetical protein
VNTIGALGLIPRTDTTDVSVMFALLKRSVIITGANGKALMKKSISASAWIVNLPERKAIIT